MFVSMFECPVFFLACSGVPGLFKVSLSSIKMALVNELGLNLYTVFESNQLKIACFLATWMLIKRSTVGQILI